MRRADPAGGEQIIVARRAARSPPRRSRASSSATTRTSASRMPCRLSQVAICATFLSWVRPDRISSPITISAGGPDPLVSPSRPAHRTVRRSRAKLQLAERAISARMTDTICTVDRRPTGRRRPHRRDQAARAGRLRRHARRRAASPPRSSTRSCRMSCPASPPARSTTSSTPMMLARGAVPATLGYRGYTKSCCTSINHVVCHGIPGDKALKDGDIVNIDVTPIARRLARRHQPHVSWSATCRSRRSGWSTSPMNA